MPISGSQNRTAFKRLLTSRGVSDGRAQRFMEDVDANIHRLEWYYNGLTNFDDKVWIQPHNPDRPTPYDEPLWTNAQPVVDKLTEALDLFAGEWKGLFPKSELYNNMWFVGAKTLRQGQESRQLTPQWTAWRGLIIIRDSVISMYEDNIKMLPASYISFNNVKVDLGYNTGQLKQIYFPSQFTTNSSQEPSEPPPNPQPTPNPGGAEIMEIITKLTNRIEALEAERDLRGKTVSGDIQITFK